MESHGKPTPNPQHQLTAFPPALLPACPVPCGYSAEQVGLCGAVMLGLGLIGSLATGFFLERSRAYQQMLWFGYLLAPPITVLIAAGT